MDKTGALAVVSKRSFTKSQLEENTNAAIDATSSRPEGFKGKFVKTVYLIAL